LDLAIRSSVITPGSVIGVAVRVVAKSTPTMTSHA
jgi:hypothetical protein